MIRKRFFFACMLFALGFGQRNFVHEVSGADRDEKKTEEGKKLFLDANIALSEERFADAHAVAEELVREHAGDYQIGLYLHLYAHTFYLLDEDFRKGGLRPTPPGMRARIEAMKAKPDKSVIDLVKLAMVGDGPGGGFCIEYLEEILHKFPESVWADWAEIELWVARRWGAVRSDTEERKQRYRGFYNFGKAFISEHPNSYLMPRLLKATAIWGCMWGNVRAKEEGMRMLQRVLHEFPSADYYCARARRKLRELLGDDYQEMDGCSEEGDRTITAFYCHSPQMEEYRKYVQEYLATREGMEAGIGKEVETEMAGAQGALPSDTDLAPLAYVLIMAAIAIGIGGLILLLKKPASSCRK